MISFQFPYYEIHFCDAMNILFNQLQGDYSLGNIYKQNFKSNCYPCTGMALINGYWFNVVKPVLFVWSGSL